MFQISSNSTLFFKIFLPIFWLAFFGMVMLVTIFVVDEPFFMGYRIAKFRIGIVLFWLSGLTFFYFTFLKLLRIDADSEFIYISNYFKNVRVPIHNIEKITTNDLGIMTVGTITLKVPGSFGKKLHLIFSEKGFKQFLTKYPDYQALL